jgi:hypothetical protein
MDMVDVFLVHGTDFLGIISHPSNSESLPMHITSILRNYKRLSRHSKSLSRHIICLSRHSIMFVFHRDSKCISTTCEASLDIFLS